MLCDGPRAVEHERSLSLEPPPPRSGQKSDPSIAAGTLKPYCGYQCLPGSTDPRLQMAKTSTSTFAGIQHAERSMCHLQWRALTGRAAAWSWRAVPSTSPAGDDQAHGGAAGGCAQAWPHQLPGCTMLTSSGSTPRAQLSASLLEALDNKDEQAQAAAASSLVKESASVGQALVEVAKSHSVMGLRVPGGSGGQLECTGSCAGLSSGWTWRRWKLWLFLMVPEGGKRSTRVGPAHHLRVPPPPAPPFSFAGRFSLYCGHAPACTMRCSTETLRLPRSWWQRRPFRQAPRPMRQRSRPRRARHGGQGRQHAICITNGCTAIRATAPFPCGHVALSEACAAAAAA